VVVVEAIQAVAPLPRLPVTQEAVAVAVVVEIQEADATGQTDQETLWINRGTNVAGTTRKSSSSFAIYWT
jgi:hypothetical protein